MKIIFTCKRCKLFFVSKNLLHVYIREARCLKQINQLIAASNKTKIQNIVKIISFSTTTKDQNFDLKFKS